MCISSYSQMMFEKRRSITLFPAPSPEYKKHHRKHKSKLRTNENKELDPMNPSKIARNRIRRNCTTFFRTILFSFVTKLFRLQEYLVLAQEYLASV